MGLAISLTAVALAAVIIKSTFLRFPMDEDFSYYTYLSHFQHEKLRLKKDYFPFLPSWRVHLFHVIYGADPKNGVVRVRLFFVVAHLFGALSVYWAAWELTRNPFSAFLAGILFAFFASVPALAVHTINMEQLYVPFLFSGIALLLKGNFPVAGVMFGMAVVPKIATGIYVPPIGIVLWATHGFKAGVVFCALGAFPQLTSLSIDWFSGYLDVEARKQLSVRYVVSLRLGKLKRMYGSVRRDIIAVLNDTLPVSVIGAPVLLFLPFHPDWPLLAVVILVTLSMIRFQQAYSRYHYMPVVAVLCVAAAAALGSPGPSQLGVWSAFVIAVATTLPALLPFYLHPTRVDVLSRYEKFDQYLYVPKVGKALGKLMRMRKETGRIFVWGNYTQIYQYAGFPATDAYLHYAIGPWDDERLAGYFDTVIGGILEHRPRYIVKTFPDLDIVLLGKITGLHYELMKVALCRFPIYRLSTIHSPKTDSLSLTWKQKLALFDELTAGPHVPGIDQSGLREGNVKQALKECRKLLRLNPKDAEALLYLNELSDKAGIEGDSGRLENLLNERPHTQGLRLGLAKHKLKEQNFPLALSCVMDEERVFGETSGSQFIKGAILRALHQPDRAAAMFQKLRNIDPKRAEFAFYLAECLLEAGRASEAAKGFQEAWDLAMNKEQEWVRTNIALRMAEREQVPEHETLGRYRKMDAANESLTYAYGSALDKAGMAESARKIFSSLASDGARVEVKGAALFRLARLSRNGERAPLLRACLKLVPHHRAAKKLLRETLHHGN